MGRVVASVCAVALLLGVTEAEAAIDTPWERHLELALPDPGRWAHMTGEDGANDEPGRWSRWSRFANPGGEELTIYRVRSAETQHDRKMRVERFANLVHGAVHRIWVNGTWERCRSITADDRPVIGCIGTGLYWGKLQLIRMMAIPNGPDEIVFFSFSAPGALEPGFIQAARDYADSAEPFLDTVGTGGGGASGGGSAEPPAGLANTNLFYAILGLLLGWIAYRRATSGLYDHPRAWYAAYLLSAAGSALLLLTGMGIDGLGLALRLPLATAGLAAAIAFAGRLLRLPDITGDVGGHRFDDAPSLTGPSDQRSRVIGWINLGLGVLLYALGVAALGTAFIPSLGKRIGMTGDVLPALALAAGFGLVAVVAGYVGRTLLSPNDEPDRMSPMMAAGIYLAGVLASTLAGMLEVVVGIYGVLFVPVALASIAPVVVWGFSLREARWLEQRQEQLSQSRAPIAPAPAAGTAAATDPQVVLARPPSPLSQQQLEAICARVGLNAYDLRWRLTPPGPLRPIAALADHPECDALIGALGEHHIPAIAVPRSRITAHLESAVAVKRIEPRGEGMALISHLGETLIDGDELRGIWIGKRDAGRDSFLVWALANNPPHYMLSSEFDFSCLPYLAGGPMWTRAEALAERYAQHFESTPIDRRFFDSELELPGLGNLGKLRALESCLLQTLAVSERATGT